MNRNARQSSASAAESAWHPILDVCCTCLSSTAGASADVHEDGVAVLRRTLAGLRGSEDHANAILTVVAFARFADAHYRSPKVRAVLLDIAAKEARRAASGSAAVLRASF